MRVYGVIVAENLFGDIISDGFAGLVGGLGFACSGNIGDEVAVFEPTHGSAPKYEKLDPPIINPIAMILSAAMLLDHVGESAKAQRVRDAIAKLPPAQRQVIVLRELEELKYREIADVLDLSLNEVKVLIHRGRKALLKILQRSPLFEGTES